MNARIYKNRMLYLVTATLLLTLNVSVVFPEHVSAGELSYRIGCEDGTDSLKVTQNHDRHETTVKCASGAKFWYLGVGPTAKPATNIIKGICSEGSNVGTEVDKPNEAVKWMKFYCTTGNGDNVQRTDETPVVAHSPVDEQDPPADDDEPTDDEEYLTLPTPARYDSVDCKTSKDDPKVSDLNESNCGILSIIVTFTRLLSAIAGLVIVGMMIMGGIRYSMAGADPSKVQAAKKMITNAILALVVYIFGFAFLQWIVPGGIF